MSNRVKPWQKRKPKHHGEQQRNRKRVIPLRTDDRRIVPLTVDDSRVSPLRAGDDFEEDGWDDSRIRAEMSKL